MTHNKMIAVARSKMRKIDKSKILIIKKGEDSTRRFINILFHTKEDRDLTLDHLVSDHSLELTFCDEKIGWGILIYEN